MTGNALVDLLQMPDEDPPMTGFRVLCRHPFQVSALAFYLYQLNDPDHGLQKN